MINTELYKIFYYTALHQNISKAAEALYISQPAVSKSIKNLEDITKCTLFKRSSKGVTLTSEGEILFEYVKNAFVHLQNGEETIKKMVNMDEGVVKVGISNTLCKYFFLPHLQAFHRLYPNVKIQIINRPSPKTLELLDGGEVDFGIVSIPENRGEYSYKPLMKIHDVFVARQGYADGGEISLAQLAGFPLMMMESGNQTRIYIEKFLHENGADIKPEIEIGSMDFLVEFAKIGIGVACVIREFVQSELESGELCELNISPVPKGREIGLVMKRNVPVSNAAGRFVDYLSKSI